MIGRKDIEGTIEKARRTAAALSDMVKALEQALERNAAEDEAPAPMPSHILINGEPVTPLFILGAKDPEMERIAGILDSHGVSYMHATVAEQDVHPGNAYKADPIPRATHWVECAPRGGHSEGVTVIDHHRPCDPGYGRPPAEFREASSIGQVLAELGITEWSEDWKLAAAADHCLGAAYRGECPGVDPDKLFLWRVNVRASFQGKNPIELILAAQSAKEALREANDLELVPGIKVKDMRRETPVPELVEAAMQLDMPYVSGPLVQPDGRLKITCSGRKHVIRAFLEHWVPAQRLEDAYGDPARGFAGAYVRL